MWTNAERIAFEMKAAENHMDVLAQYRDRPAKSPPQSWRRDACWSHKTFAILLGIIREQQAALEAYQACLGNGTKSLDEVSNP